jgi:hypothetical protein
MAASPSTLLAGFAALVPEGVDPLDAVPLTCAGVTTYEAVKQSEARPSGPCRRLRHRRARPPGPSVRHHRCRRLDQVDDAMAEVLPDASTPDSVFDMR